jgi:hypothetical protein
MTSMATRSWSPDLFFTLKGAFLAGKVLDRNISPTKPSFAQAMDLDEQMAEIANSMPADWWTLPSEPKRSDAGFDDLREHILLQFFFFHVKLYIHLPFIGLSSMAASYDVSRLKCMEASRELLSRFILLRSEARGPCLFECKTTDFVGFTAATVLLICLSRSSDETSDRYSDDGANLIASTESIFEKQESKGCKIAAQCLGTLRFLSHRGSNAELESSSRQANGIRIPFFGTVVKKHLDFMPTQSLSTGGNGSNGGRSTINPAESGGTAIQGTQPLLMDEISFQFHGCNTMAPTLGGPLWDDGNISGGDFSSWADIAMMDINQDWGVLHDMPTF